MESNYLANVKLQFEYYKSVGDKTFDQISENELFWQYNANSNSIAIIVNHIHGNMKSRWTDFLTSDGEKEWRKRDEEFEDIIKTRGELLKKWEEGWQILFSAIDSINPDNFGTTIYIRNQQHTVVDAFNRQLAHYAYHIGQIVYVAKMTGAENWQSLTIPKGKSKEFNSSKISKGKHDGHFSDDLK